MTPEELQAAQKTVEEMAAAGDLPPESYYKCIVTLAARWLTEHHEAEQALVLINRCPPSYIETTLCDQMAEDAAFAALVVGFSYRLIQLGLSTEDTQAPTQTAGRA